MVEFDFRRPGRHCSVEDRPLRPGEDFFSALVEDANEQLVRVDVSSGAWTGPPEGCLGWWQGRVPNLEKGRVYWAPVDVLLACFQHEIEQKHFETAFVMALLLVRKRILQWNETETTPEGSEMVLTCARNKSDYRVRECPLGDEQVAKIQNELSEKLFTDQADQEPEPEGDRE